MNDMIKTVGEKQYWDLPKMWSKIDMERSCASKTTGIMLASLVFSNNVKVAIEIGIANGFTTQCIGWALATSFGPDAELISLDKNKNSCNIAEKCAIPIKHRVECVDTTEVNFSGILGDSKIDLAYIDGDHSYEGESNDIRKVKPFLSKSGIMVIHDYNYGLPEVMKAVSDNFDWDEWEKFVVKERGDSNDIQSAIIQRRFK